MMVVQLISGIILTGALILALIFSGFILFVVISSQQIRTGTSLLLLQLGTINSLLAILFLALSAPSLLQDKWLTSKNQKNITQVFEMSLQSVDDLTTSLSMESLPRKMSRSLQLQSFNTSSYKQEPGFAYPLVMDSLHLLQEPETKNSNNIIKQLNGTLKVMFVYEGGNMIINEAELTNLQDIFIGEGWFCQVYGWALITLHVAAVWIIVGLHFDKFCAISAPLRYNTLVTRQRVAVYSCVAWLIAFATAFTPFLTAQIYVYIGGACLPAWHVEGSFPYTISLSVATLIIPGFIIGGFNSRILVIARRHQHRIFSAILEVMISAQATLTHQQNPFEVPKKKQKSMRSVMEQMIAFVVCYCPLFIVALWESVVQHRLNTIVETTCVGCFLVAPLINSFLYGIKCKTLRKSFKNYLRKRLYKSEVKSEIEARIPSAQNSRRPSSSSSNAMPFIHRTLKRRMSDYLMKDIVPPDDADEIRMVRRSSDLSWHPLDEMSPKKLKKSLDVHRTSGLSPADRKSLSHYLTVPSFEDARSYCKVIQQDPLSHFSFDPDDLSETIQKKNSVEEETFLTPEGSPLNYKLKQTLSSSPQLFSSELCEGDRKNSMTNSIMSKDALLFSSCTPLLITAYEQVQPTKPVDTSSPYIGRTLDALMSIRLSQSLLRASSFLRSRSKESINGPESYSECQSYISLPIGDNDDVSCAFETEDQEEPSSMTLEKEIELDINEINNLTVVSFKSDDCCNNNQNLSSYSNYS